MKKQAKRICALLLALTILTSMFSLSSISAFAEEINAQAETQTEVQTEAQNEVGVFHRATGDL